MFNKDNFSLISYSILFRYIITLKTWDSNTRHYVFKKIFDDVQGPVVNKYHPCLLCRVGRGLRYGFLHIDSMIKNKDRRDSSSRSIEHT